MKEKYVSTVIMFISFVAGYNASWPMICLITGFYIGFLLALHLIEKTLK